MSSEVTKTERDQTIKLDVSAKVYPTKEIGRASCRERV